MKSTDFRSWKDAKRDSIVPVVTSSEPWRSRCANDMTVGGAILFIQLIFQKVHVFNLHCFYTKFLKKKNPAFCKSKQVLMLTN